MRVILEGVDGSGKTTLANILAHKYGLQICHCTQHDPTDFNFYKETLRKENVVWDRHTIGELIYPKVFDRKTNVTGLEVKAIIDRAKSEGAKIFVLTCGEKELEERVLAKKNEDERIVKSLRWIDNSFRYWAECLNVPVIDTSTMTIGQIFNLVESKY